MSAGAGSLRDIGEWTSQRVAYLLQFRLEDGAHCICFIWLPNESLFYFSPSRRVEQRVTPIDALVLTSNIGDFLQREFKLHDDCPTSFN